MTVKSVAVGVTVVVLAALAGLVVAEWAWASSYREASGEGTSLALAGPFTLAAVAASAAILRLWWPREYAERGSRLLALAVLVPAGLAVVVLGLLSIDAAS